MLGLAVCTAMLGLALTAGTAQARTAAFAAHGSAEQAYATGLRANRRVSLVNARGRVVATKRADSLGGVVFRGVTPGRGYRVRQGGARSGKLTVFSNRSAPPSTKIYDQQIPASGYGYLTTRDGTKLAIDVRLPAGPGPYPTLVEYAGYGYADPAGAQSGISQIANLLGFAVVDVNMRGTGCSGGSYDYFEPLQSLDGYDVIETVAHQPWVLHHKVGMLGISYGGISQLFVASTDPPDLAAIAPLSTIDNTATTLYPGGILNTGFALVWGEQRVHDAKPASATGGQPWALQRIQEGDQTCKENQVLHGEAPDLVAKIHANPYYVPAVANPLAPVTFVHKIHVPTYLACQWTDEQTGGHCADLAQHFTGTRHKWFTFTNGVHVDSLDPDTFNRWYDFLKLYVAQQAPHLSAAAQALAPTLYQQAMGISGITLPPDPIQQIPTYAGALAAFQALPSVRILFDNGAGGSAPGQPYPGFERSFSRFPIPGTRAQSWYLGKAGTITPASLRAGGPISSGGTRRAAGDRLHRRHRRRRSVGDDPGLQLGPDRAGAAASYVTAPLASNTTVIGGGARPSLGEVVGAQRRPAGDDLRGAARRQGDVRPERLAAGKRAQAGSGP